MRESRRVKTALVIACPTAIKTIHGFDFGFRFSLYWESILGLPKLNFIDRAEIIHLIGQSSTGKSYLATELSVEAVEAGRNIAFTALANFIASLAKVDYR